MRQSNLTKVKACMRKAQNGGEMTIAFLGGSITQGSLATTEENTYAYRVFSWWQKTFPETEFHYVNGGIGGTSSHYGVARAVSDVLMYQPDFVVVDFSVNDNSDTFFQEMYEGVVRRLLQWDSKPAVLLLNNVYYDTGKNAQEYHNAVGDWYCLPHVSIKDTLYQEMRQGKYKAEQLTPDGLHPNDKGHELVAEEIIQFLENVKCQIEETKTEEEKQEYLPEPMTENSYEKARRLTIREISPKLLGFRADAREKIGHLDHFKNGWIGKKQGDRIIFEVEASCIAVQYRKTIKRPALRAKLILDGNKENSILLDGNFDEDWGDCLYLQPVLHHGESKIHTIEIEIMLDEKEMATPFYLMALIVA